MRRRKQEARDRRRKEGRKRIGLDYLSLLKAVDVGGAKKRPKSGKKRASDSAYCANASGTAMHTPRESVYLRDSIGTQLRSEGLSSVGKGDPRLSIDAPYAGSSQLVVHMPSVAQERAEELRRSCASAVGNEQQKRMFTAGDREELKRQKRRRTEALIREQQLRRKEQERTERAEEE